MVNNDNRPVNRANSYIVVKKGEFLDVAQNCFSRT